VQSGIHVIKANNQHTEGISKVCTDGYWATYGNSHPKKYIQRIVDEFYNVDRISNEVTISNKHWGGYFVAVENGNVIGAGGGGMIGDNEGEIFVLYIDPHRRNEGIGTMILNAITEQQEGFGARKQWVSVQKGNRKGIPFYEARGFNFKYEKPGYGNVKGEDFISLRYSRTV